MNYRNSILEHYGCAGLSEAIVRALEAQGKDIRKISRDDLLALDEFHIRGRKATRELARIAGLAPGMKVLDIGCGIGGPARTIAAEFGCHVTGIDIVEEYVAAASMLAQQLGLAGQTEFRCTDVSSLPGGDEHYDAVWSQHLLMNIPAKADLFHTIHNALRCGGVYAFFEICSDPGDSIHFPVPWSSSEATHYPIGAASLRASLRNLFREQEWQDSSAESLAWYRKAAAAPELPALGVQLLMGETSRQKMMNVVRNLEDGRISVIRGVMIKD